MEGAEGTLAADVESDVRVRGRRGSLTDPRTQPRGAASQGVEPRGLFESVSALVGIESEFDPHQYRHVDKPTSYLETATHMVKGSIGAGVLAMPSAVRKVGLPIGLLGIILIGMFAVYCLHLLIHSMYETCKRHRRGYLSYKTCMREGLKVGPKTKWLAPVLPEVLEISLVVWQLGLCTVYAVSVASNMQMICSAQWPEHQLSLRQHLLLQLLPLVLVCHFKNLKILAPVSTFANLVTLTGFVLVFFYLMDAQLVLTSEQMQFKGIEQVPLFIGITLFSLEAVGVILALEYSMEEPKRFVGLCGLLNRCMTGVIGLYCLVGGTGYARFGENTKDSIVLNMPIDDTMAKIAILSFALALFLSFPLQNYVAHQMIWIRLQPRLHARRLYTANLLLKLFCVVFPWLVAFAIPKLGPIIGLFGALCLSLLGLVFPALLDLCLWWQPAPAQAARRTSRQEELTPARRRWWLTRDLLIILLGMLALLSGVYTSVLEIIHAP